MTKIGKTQPAKPVQQTQGPQKKEKTKTKDNAPSIGKLLAGRAMAIGMAPIAAISETLLIAGKGVAGAVEGAISKNKTIGQGIDQGVREAMDYSDDYTELIGKMWDGKI